MATRRSDWPKHGDRAPPHPGLVRLPRQYDGPCLHVGPRRGARGRPPAGGVHSSVWGIGFSVTDASPGPGRPNPDLLATPLDLVQYGNIQGVESVSNGGATFQIH